MDGTAPSQERIGLRAGGPDGAACGWRDQIDPTGRSLFLVLTDGIGNGWRNGAALGMVAGWARYSSVALVSLLPQRLWHLSGLSPVRTQLLAPTPGAPNGRLRARVGEGAPIANAAGLPVPVLGLEPDWWHNWARLIATPESGWIDATAVFVSRDATTKDHETDAPPRSDDLSPSDRVLRFRTFASVPAFQLAGLLAAVPLSLPTIRLVQRVMLPNSDISTIAEVLLGGLLNRMATRPDDANSVAYEFHDGVRAELLSNGRRGDTVRVARLVNRQFAANSVLRNFDSALADPVGAPESQVTEESKPYLTVQEAVFRALSGSYAPRAARLRRALRSRSGQKSTSLRSSPSMITNPSRFEPAQAGLRERAEMTATEPSIIVDLSLPKGGQMVAGPIHSDDSGRSAARQPQVWGFVPLRNPDFVGRGPLLEKLRERLEKPGEATAVLPEALHGMGGVGKSQTVVEYIYRHASEYNLVWWVPAEHPTQIAASFVELAKRLGITAGSAETALPAVLEALRNGVPYPRWILIFDNAEHPDVVRPFLPTGLGHVVVTSRNSEWIKVARTVEVDLFTRPESMELLRRRGGGEISDEDADRLAEALGDLPLAVEQAASWRAQTGMPVVEYVRLLEENSAELLEAGATSEYERPVAAAWNVPLNRLRTDRRGALELLQVCAFFGPDPISRGLFTGGRGAPVPEALAEAFADPIKLNHAIREISKYSLAKIDHRSNTLQLHRLVQAVLRDQLDASQWDNMRHTVHLMLVTGDPDDPESSTNWPTYASLLPHALSSRAVVCRDNWVRTLVTNLVRYLLSVGDYRGALSLAEAAWTARKASLGEEHLDTLVMGRHYGNALWRVGRVEDARKHNQGVYQLMLETLGEDHDATISMSDALGSDYRARGMVYDERDAAQTTFERAQRLNGDNDPATLRYANNLAASLRLAGDYREARALDEQTLARRRSVLGEYHSATLNTLSGLAMDVRECGLYVEACEMQEDTSARARRLLGPDHPTTIGGDRCLAVARRKAGLHDKAMELTKECYDRYRLRHGEGHIDTVTGLMDMTTELRHMNELQESLEYGLRSVREFEQIYYSEHPFVMIAATNLAVTLRLIGDVEEARQLNERAIAGFRDRVGDDHPYTLVAMANLASDLAELGELEAAKQTDSQTLARGTARLGAEHPTTLAVAHNLSIDMNLLGDSNEAAILHTNTLASFRKMLGDDHPATVAASQNVRANCDTDTMQL
jgi:hypothetical protein